MEQREGNAHGSHGALVDPQRSLTEGIREASWERLHVVSQTVGQGQDLLSHMSLLHEQGAQGHPEERGVIYKVSAAMVMLVMLMMLVIVVMLKMMIVVMMMATMIVIMVVVMMVMIVLVVMMKKMMVVVVVVGGAF